jgi:aminopeptidase N
VTPRLLAAAALLCACTASCAHRAASLPADARAALPLHHDLKVALEPGTRRISVEDTITLSPELRARSGDAVELSLHAGLSPERLGGPPLARVEAGAARAGPVPIERFVVRLAPSERAFTVRYGGELFHPVREVGEGVRKAGESPGIVSAEGAVLYGASAWVPDLGEALVSFTLEARVPAGWDAVSQGRRARHERGERETVVRWESPEPQEEVFLVAAPFVERSREGARFVVQTFLRSDDPELARTYLDAGERWLATYDALVGPYPYAKFALVENFWETGYGMPSFTLLGPRVIRLPFLVHSSYPHEILHNWFGNGIYVDPSGGNWSEGLTAYLADHLVQEQRGQGAEYRRGSLQRFADYVAASADFPVREFRARHGEVTQAVGYDKVLMTFHMLRQRMGDERFVAGLRRLWADQRFRAATFADVARAMSAAAREDVAPWLAQWLDRPGAPAIRLESASTGRDGRVLELTLSQAQDGAPYDVDVPVAVTVEGAREAVRRTVRLSERRQQFSVELPARPVRVDVDPEHDVFRRLDPAELPPSMSGAFGASEALLVLPSAAREPLRSAYAAVAERWRGPGRQVVTDAQLERIPPGKAVWILGWENRLRESVASGVAAHGGAFAGEAVRAGAAALRREEHTVAVAVRSPADPAQVLVFVGAPRAEPLPGLARKLPHYGSYGVVGFEGDEPTNVVKERWAVLRSPMAAAVDPAAARPERGPGERVATEGQTTSDELPARGMLPPRTPLASAVR